MVKKDDNLDAWRTQYPSTVVSWNLIGDNVYCQRFIGEAKAMLYTLKNRMKLSASLDPAYGLKSHQDIQRYDDGTVIIVKSVYGQDFIEINAGIAAGLPRCSITLFDVPEMVQPMHWYADGIHDSEWLIANPDGELEVEGVDYIKTYYYSKPCSTCLLDFSICDSDELPLTYGWTALQFCKPFVFENADYPVNNYYENDHCIYGNCQAEIIKFGSDENGKYFLWKAYTEWSTLGPWYADFTKSGLGYLLMYSFMTLPNGQKLCESDQSIVKVDCCLKAPAERVPIIYWEKCIGGGWCIAPSEGTIEEDLDYFWQYGGWINMGLWAKGNWCKPMTWTLLSGIGEITTSEDGTFGYYKVPYAELGDFLETDCHNSVQIAIEGQDRCGTKDSIVFNSTPCCDSAGPVSLGYTTLLMACSGVQTFTTSGGCEPYSWSLTGGGTLVDNKNGTATYTAPATNPNCTSNPTISVSDCCGTSDSIKIAVNCYTTSTDAYVLWDDTVSYSHTGCYDCGSGIGAVYWHYLSAVVYKCDGTVNRTCSNAAIQRSTQSTPYLSSNGTYCGYGFYSTCMNAFANTLGTTGWHLATDIVNGTDCGCTDPKNQGCAACYANYVLNYCIGGNTTAIPGENDAWDVRSAAAITGGCCPINPLTGLPF